MVMDNLEELQEEALVLQIKVLKATEQSLIANTKLKCYELAIKQIELMKYETRMLIPEAVEERYKSLLKEINS